MGQLISVVIDGLEVQVPPGTLVVDAAKKAGVDIPVFCYHPKMEPVGMCRMCLVEIGRPQMSRKTGELERNEDGSYVIQFAPKLETGCTVVVSEGMVVRGISDKVARARKDVIEFLLTSHPLDCPVCDKGGECPLQNLTMDFGSGESRFLYDEKIHFEKHYPLGELIFLDRERCIQCGRCVRFQDEIVDDAVIGFEQRGRSLRIVTYSEPGFDSYFSGNTTDICPVGALTTSDFRFGARPWEMKAVASICTHCPVGCNLTLNVRREHKTGGDFVVKRVLPRQNEAVNEIWICDKGRFAHHYTSSPDRLIQPLVKENGELTPATWDNALKIAASKLKEAGSDLLTLVSGRISNEDLFNLQALSKHLGGSSALLSEMAGGDLVAQVGVSQGTNLSDLGPESTILVVASDLEEEAPLYWLRVKQAAERGAKLIVANPRHTKTDRSASHVLRYPYGGEAALVIALTNALSKKRVELTDKFNQLGGSQEVKSAAKEIVEAENVLIFYGSEGTGFESSQQLAQACANLLISTGHIGKVNNGLIPVWPRGNTQGAWDMGFQPVPNLNEVLTTKQAIYIAAADPAGDNPKLAEAIQSAGFVLVQDIYLTETAKLADVVLPAKTFIEREGTFTNAERRVQRFYAGIPPRPQTRPDFAITAQISRLAGIDLEDRHPIRIMDQIAGQIPDYAEVSYGKISAVAEQWPIIGRSDLYYGGTSYENSQGLGYQVPPASQKGQPVSLSAVQPGDALPGEGDELTAYPITILYDRGQTVMTAELLHRRIPEPFIIIHPESVAHLGIKDGDRIHLHCLDFDYEVVARLDETIQEGVVLSPRSMGLPIREPMSVEIKLVEQVVT
ncbi:MAG: NADH-quinone oxidoreductase subunit NuoG [Chloroflexota bacterium]|nr:MAG: NADH-quinone oxidoreductase subunit NuoG [Chloroflexota bacterium]